jgi:PAT family beta-lactamase induction signal transducer AmpG
VASFPGGSEKLARLMVTIGGENLAIGIAGAAFVAWMSSIVSKQFAAVQYALLSSLTLLVGTLGRGALGQMIERQGFYDVFVLTTWIGVGAMVLVVLEWWRQTHSTRSGVVTPEAKVVAAVPAE